MKIGKLTENIYKRSVLKEIKHKRKEIINGAGIGEDCAILSFYEGAIPAAEKKTVTGKTEGAGQSRTTDQTVVTGITTVTGITKDVGRIAVHRAANNLAASGGEPVAVMFSLLLPESSEETELKNIIRQMEETCLQLDIQITGGHTEIAVDIKHPVLTVSGTGKSSDNTYRLSSMARPDQDVVISKWIGLEGTSVIAKEKQEELVKRFSPEYIENAMGFDRYLSIIPEAATAVKSGAGAMHNVTHGGIFGALWEMAESSGVGLEIDLKKIPVRQETIEICNYFDINPYELMSTGCLLMTSDNGYDLAECLKRDNIEASVIGKTTGNNDRLIINEDEKRFLTPPVTDELFKIII